MGTHIQISATDIYLSSMSPLFGIHLKEHIDGTTSVKIRDTRYLIYKDNIMSI